MDTGEDLCVFSCMIYEMLVFHVCGIRVGGR